MEKFFGLLTISRLGGARIRLPKLWRCYFYLVRTKKGYENSRGNQDLKLLENWKKRRRDGEIKIVHAIPEL